MRQEEPRASSDRLSGLRSLREERASWYALYVRARWERHVASIMEGFSFETFFPTREAWERRGASPKRIQVPILPCYLFVRTRLTKNAWLDIKKTTGGVRILGIGTDPLPVPDHEVESLRTILKVQPRVHGHPCLRSGDLVRVVKGPLRGVIGRLTDVARNRQRLVVSIDLLNQAVATHIDAEMVEPYA